jgi:hypothetical protein
MLRVIDQDISKVMRIIVFTRSDNGANPLALACSGDSSLSYETPENEKRAGVVYPSAGMASVYTLARKTVLLGHLFSLD